MSEIKARIQTFVDYWQGHGKEKQETQRFWIDLLQNVYGVENITSSIEFEKPVMLGHQSFIDAYISDTKVLIEQKSSDIDLRKEYKQSDGSLCTPYEQAKRYAQELPLSEKPRFIVTCNFHEFLVYDQETPQAEPYQILLKNLPAEYKRLSFLTNLNTVHIQKQFDVSVQAGELVGEIYSAFRSQYKDPNSEASARALNILCVRLVFCLYAEDAGLFKQDQFYEYMNKIDPIHMRNALLDLFDVLNTPVPDRDPYLEPELNAFPYVDGGLFAEKNIEIPNFTDEIKDILLNKSSFNFNWKVISPTIFGALFESTLNPETRRSGGMHYTSIENIHKVIDPLFLDELKDELNKIENDINARSIYVDSKGGRRLKGGLLAEHQRALRAYQDRLASLSFLDPACGSGNFLTETFLSLRKLENRVLLLLANNNTDLFTQDFVKVQINHFYGIEINDFAVSVAKTALWIAEAQMLEETNSFMSNQVDFLPLKSYVNIVEGNALRTDWSTVVPQNELDYIMSNPPFLGYSMQSGEQKDDILSIYLDENEKPLKQAGKIDYVAGWFYKAAAFMKNTGIKTAFVATNSITQGEQVQPIWEILYSKYGIDLNFAYRTFVWNSEAADKAHVHCVIIGFSCGQNETKFIFSDNQRISVKSLNPYLTEAQPIFITSRKKPICDVGEMVTGNRPADGGHLIIEEDEYDDFVAKEPQALPYIKRLLGSSEFINNQRRYCLWLVGVSPAQLNSMPWVRKRIDLCRQDRLSSPDRGRQKLADTPALFRETFNPDNFLLIPCTSSSNRFYLPIGFFGNDVISTNANLLLPNATIYDFGVLESLVHMAWMRTVAGRLKSDYRYSKDIVYNNFVWPSPSPEQKNKIEQTARAIIDARALYPDSSMADLYDSSTMPVELRKAHRANDAAVMEAYGFDKNLSESEIVAELFGLYIRTTEHGTK